MGKWAWAVVVLGVVIGLAIAMASYRPYAPSPPGTQVQATATHKPQTARRFRPFYQRHRDQVLHVSDYSHRVRTNRIVAAVCFFIFAFLTLPKSARDIRAFYHQLVATRPLPDSAGAADDDDRRARQVLFFYLLFLLYQIVQFPLTWGRDNAVQFCSDLGFQFVLLCGVVATFRSLKRGVAERLAGDPAARERMRAWLGARLEGVSIRWGDLSRLALGMFVGAFTPALLANLPSWLDIVASY